MSEQKKAKYAVLPLACVECQIGFPNDRLACMHEQATNHVIGPALIALSKLSRWDRIDLANGYRIENRYIRVYDHELASAVVIGGTHGH